MNVITLRRSTKVGDFLRVFEMTTSKAYKSVNLQIFCFKT
jgi:hypothetical protein